MTVAPSIDPARFLHEHLEQASPDLLRDMLTFFIDTLLSADADAICGADYRTVAEDRTNRRNGHRHRDFDSVEPESWFALCVRGRRRSGMVRNTGELSPG